MGDLEKALETLRAHIKASRLKQTGQRETVLKVFLAGPKHVELEGLARLVQKKDPKVGFSTVYRSMKLFTECGLAKEHKFLYGKTSFEHSVGEQPHDYLVCRHCGSVQEFSNPLIQAVQEKVSKELDFKLEQHRLELYGVCSKCQGPVSKRPVED